MLDRRALERWGDDEAYQKYRENTPHFSLIHEKIIEVDAFSWPVKGSNLNDVRGTSG